MRSRGRAVLLALWALGSLAPAVADAAAPVDPAVAVCKMGPTSTQSTQGDSVVRLEVDPTTRWQPVGGHVLFTLEGPDIPDPNLQVFVCFRWHRS